VGKLYVICSVLMKANMFRASVHDNAIIDNGPPARYRLKLEKKKLDGDEAKLIRYTLGKKDPTKPNKTILLVGETGSGKSSFINTFLNYAMGVKEGDKVWYEIVDETVKISGSVTSQVTVYEIYGFEGKTLPYSLTIIDTPGYGDTRGIEKDAVIAQELYDLFRSEKGIHTVDVVGLVMKATDNRLSDRLMYILNSALALFGKDLEKNLVALITHSNGMTPTVALKALQDANIKLAKNKRNQPVHFEFNNCQSTKIAEDTEDFHVQSFADNFLFAYICLFRTYVHTISTSNVQYYSVFLFRPTPPKKIPTPSTLSM
uniref:AIG1-type G domain-containing protein n=1 Tax=Fundulus heteroclitus TaxID=8078 RepID=A0A3Q2NQR4_FUNHE